MHGIDLMSPVILSDLTPLKISTPNEVTEDGIDICVNFEHLENALFPIEVTKDGIVKCASFIQL